MSDHTSKQFDAEMEAIRAGSSRWADSSKRSSNRAIALLQDDDRDAIVQVKVDEKQINRMQVDLDQMCSQIIARRQPAAIDLRFVLMITKIVNELERVGDEVKKIAYKAAEIRGMDRLSHVRHYEVIRTAERAGEMLQMALDTFARLDVGFGGRGHRPRRGDRRRVLAIMRQLISYMMEDPRTITAALEIVFIAKSIERIGDTRRTSRRRWSRWSRASMSGTRPLSRSAPRWRRNDAVDPRRRGRARDPRAAAGQSGRRGIRGAGGAGRGICATGNQRRIAAADAA